MLNFNSFSIKRDGHRFETFLQGDFGTASNVSDMGTDERKFEAKLNLKWSKIWKSQTFDRMSAFYLHVELYIFPGMPNTPLKKAILE